VKYGLKGEALEKLLPHKASSGPFALSLSHSPPLSLSLSVCV
jgi:hypothetical protein